VSALIVVFAMIGGLFPALLPSASFSPGTLKVEPAQQAYFVLVIAFAAGFSERLVIQAISSATRSKD
jgi:hypothetical protein